MNKFVINGIVIFALGAPLFATPACTSNTVAFYESLGSTGCQEGNYVLSNFDYLLSANVLSTPVTASQIQVNPGLGANGPTLDFAATFTASGVASVGDVALVFNISALSGSGIEFRSVDLSTTGSRTAFSTAAVAEVDCLGGLLNVRSVPYTGLGGVACLGGGVAASANALLPAGTGVNAFVNIPLAPEVQTIDVIKDITLTAVAGTATIIDIGQSFNTVQATPEPMTFLLAGLTLAVIGFTRRG